MSYQMNVSNYYGASINTHPHGGTPKELLNEIKNKYGELFDPCPNNFTIDGLSIEWPMNKTVFVNPPYTRGEIKKWAEKCYIEHLKGVKIVLLIPSYTDTLYFHDFIYPYAKLQFIKGRLKFLGYDNKASFPSMICLFNL